MNALTQVANGGSLASHALQRVRDHIRGNDLKVGDSLPSEGWFASELGVSRAVMREAFGALAALRLIDVGNGRRARVGAIDGSVMAASLDHAVTTAQVSVAEVWDVRRTLELRTAELAARHRSQADLDDLARAVDGMEAAGSDMAAMTRSDIRFHQAIARASGNALFHQIVRSFEPLMIVAVPTAWETRVTDAQRSAILDLHGAIAAAIRTRDAGHAARLMNDHFDSSIGDLIAPAR